MTDELPAAVEEAFAAHEAFSPTPTGAAYAVDTTVFEGTVRATEMAGDAATTYVVTVRVPSLQAATREAVGEAVADGWFEALTRRVPDAPGATRADVALERAEVERDDADVVVTMAFAWPDADRAAEIAKTFVEYVEGTYVEGIVPGYDYQGPVADLLSRASSHAEGDGEGGTRGGTPL
jgi:hypothetical protein